MEIKSEIKKGEKSTVDIIGEIQTGDFEKYRSKAIERLGVEVEIKGFRKGHVPADVVEKQVGPMAILDEMAHLAVQDAYPLLLEKHDVKAIGHPKVNITKLATGNPLGFTITTSVLPEITLADYKKIAQKEMSAKEDIAVSDKELGEAIVNIQKMRAQQEHEGHNHDISDEHLPELDDAFVKSLGKFENVADFKAKLKENLEQEKKARASEKKQIATMEAIIKDSKIEVPEMLIEFELEKMFGQLENDIAMSGMKFDEYLKKIEKTREDLKKDWHESAEKRAKMQLLINEIAAVEKLQPNEKELEEEVKKIMEQYKDMKDINENSVRAYVASLLINQSVFKFFEQQKKTEK